jgi:hypothetical protein
MLHEETRSRWSALEAEKFIATVLYGALREQTKLVYTQIAVYTQIMHGQPRAQFVAASGESHPQYVDTLRDLLKYMRACITDAKDVVFGEGPTYHGPYTHAGFIIYMVSEIRRNIQEVERCARLIEQDALLNTLTAPGLEGRSAGSIATDICSHLDHVAQLLDFAQSYAEKLQKDSRSKNR